ncbi:glycine cleavage system H protein 2, mitochondrial-like protein [Tanacetum coccineum]
MATLMNESKLMLTVSIGFTDNEHDHLGDLVHVESQEVGSAVIQDSSFGAAKSVKATRNINSHASQKVIEVKRRAQLLTWLVLFQRILIRLHDGPPTVTCGYLMSTIISIHTCNINSTNEEEHSEEELLWTLA